MRSLNTSLPRSPRRRKSHHPPEQLIQAFKTAALSVTNLYKTAATDQETAREIGYQEALDDLLSFLDQENIGLDDGEGWRIRQWATERLDNNLATFGSTENEEDAVDVPRRARSNSPTVAQPSGEDRHASQSPSSKPASTPPVHAIPDNLDPADQKDSHETFTFRSSLPYPQDTEMSTNGFSDQDRPSPSQPSPMLANQPAPSFRVEVVPKHARNGHRSTMSTSRGGSKSSPTMRLSGPTTGSKRRFTFGDYFDVGNLGDLRDASGGGKRSKFT